MDAFQLIDFVIIQIDTDHSFELPFDVSHEENGIKISVEQLIEKVKQRFRDSFLKTFGQAFSAEYEHRILFAIAVHSTECWLLPLFHNDSKDKSETKNCYKKLNKAVKGLEKTYKFYDTKFDDLRFAKRLHKAASANPSFKIFIENELKTKIPLQNA